MAHSADRAPHGHRPAPAGALALVLKADTLGTLAAATAALATVAAPGGPLELIHRGVGAVAKSDLDMAATGSCLVLGFGVGVNPKVDQLARELGVEVRLYDVIYDLVREAEAIADSLAPRDPGEQLTGQAKVIRLFKSTRRGMILGCEVLKGSLALGERFRVIAAPGTVYEGRVDSLHIEDHAVREARVGQQVGLKIRDFQGANLGDLVECFRPLPATGAKPWSPRAGVHGGKGLLG